MQNSEFFFIWLPFWTVFIAINLVITSILFAILIIPGYIIGFFVILRMTYWWFKNKRLDKLTQKQQQIHKNRDKKLGKFSSIIMPPSDQSKNKKMDEIPELSDEYD